MFIALWQIMYDIIFRFFEKEWIIISALSILLIIEIIARNIKKRLKKKIYSQYDGSTNPEDSEYYLEYYRRSQLIDLVRAVSFIIFLSFFLVSKAWLNVNFFAVAAGALIIIFKDFLLSIVAFFIIIRKYAIGDTIAIGDLQWQIIFIRTFSVWVLGKDNDGDSTGKLFEIPSQKFITETVRKEELKTTSIRKELIKIPYKTIEFDTGFNIFLDELRKHLDSFLPLCNRKNAGNYQTYIGYRYKLDIDYLEEKCIIITVWIVWKWDDNVIHKEKIIEFVESHRKKLPENTQV